MVLAVCVRFFFNESNLKNITYSSMEIFVSIQDRNLLNTCDETGIFSLL